MKRFTVNCMEAIFISALLASFLVCGSGWAQEKFPAKPIENIVPWAAGGGQDLTIRALQPQLERALGQPIVIVNKVGAGGAVGFNAIAIAPSDGYTIGQASPGINITKYTVKADVDYVKFEPVIFVGYSPCGILVRKEAPWNNLKDFLAYAKANPEKVRLGNSGYGGNFHISAIGMEQAAGVKFIHVPYKGAAPSIVAILGGHIDAISSAITDCFHLMKAGRLKALGFAAPERSKFVPEAQTFKELGMDAEFITYYAWLAPKGVSKERIRILENAFRKAAESKEFNDYCNTQGVTIAPKGPEEYGSYLAKEDKKWGDLIRIGGIKPE